MTNKVGLTSTASSEWFIAVNDESLRLPSKRECLKVLIHYQIYKIEHQLHHREDFLSEATYMRG